LFFAPSASPLNAVASSTKLTAFALCFCAYMTCALWQTSPPGGVALLLEAVEQQARNQWGSVRLI
jgi:hypothetical protein